MFEIGQQGIANILGQRHATGSMFLAIQPQARVWPVDVGEAHAPYVSGPQTKPRQQKNDRPVTHPDWGVRVAGGDDPFDVGRARVAHERREPPLRRRRYRVDKSGPAFATSNQEAEIRTQHRYRHPHRCPGALRVLIQYHLADRGGVEGRRIGAQCRQPTRCLTDIALDCFGGRSPVPLEPDPIFGKKRIFSLLRDWRRGLNSAIFL